MVGEDAVTAPLREHASPQLRQTFSHLFSLWREDAAMRDWVVAERDSALAELHAFAAERHGLLAERDAARTQLAAVRGSTSWRLTGPLRRVSELLLRRRGEAGKRDC
jgi:hypothetical protein